MNVSNIVTLIVCVFINYNLSLVESQWPEVRIVNVTAEIEHHYAVTKVAVEYFNPSDVQEEVYFEIAVPEPAFITGLDLYANGRWSKSRVAKKDDANNEYDDAIEMGSAASLVFHSKVREAYGFAVLLNMQPRKTASVVLKFEQLLLPTKDQYSWTFFLIVEQDIPELAMNIHIREDGKIKNIAPSIQHVNDVTKRRPIDQKYVTINQASNNEADVSVKVPKPGNVFGNWNSENNGISMQFELPYEIESSSQNGVVLIDDSGNFVHFLPAPQKTPLPKHVVFVLDTSLSMKGRKLEQLKNAMTAILDRLSPKDYFNIVDYGSSATVRYLGRSFRDIVTQKVGRQYPIKFGSGILDSMIQDVPHPFPVSQTYIKLAKHVIDDFKPSGATNIYDSLKLGFHLVEQSENLPNNPEPIIIFLTDGKPTVGNKKYETIIDMTKQMNSAPKKINLYTLGFGRDANQTFLRQISALNSGFMKYIYEETDASEQIQALFDRVSSPVLSNVDFEYVVEDEDTTESKFNVLYKGQELFVAGRLKNQKWDQQYSPHEFKVTATSIYGKQVFVPKLVKIYGNGLEKVRVYGKVAGLIDDAIRQGKNSTEACNLALQYSFVTPYTSLIVNDKMINPAKIDSSLDFHNRRTRSTSISLIHELPWINQTISLNGTEYDIGQYDTILNETNIECDEGNTGEVGICKLLWKCPRMYSLVKEFHTYQRYFCALEGNRKYAGICCTSVFENKNDNLY